MSGASSMQMGTDKRANVLPIKDASGPGFLGPNYNPADEMLPPASINVRRGDSLDDVLGAVKGIIYYGDMIGFGGPSSSFTQGMPGLRPLGVNYFINSGLICSNGATMWEYVQTIPTGGALGQKVKDAIRGIGLPELRGMAPGMLEDTQAALNPFPVINAVVGSGYPQCRLVKKPVGDFDGKIYNVDGDLLVDKQGLIQENGKFYQEHWIQDRKVTGPNRPGESDDDKFARSDPIQLGYDIWDKTPKTHNENGCIKDIAKTPPSATMVQPAFCTQSTKQGFQNYKREKSQTQKLISLTLVATSLFSLIVFLSLRRK
jgi:hypothetical protein